MDIIPAIPAGHFKSAITGMNMNSKMMVELVGLEPTASSLRTTRSPN
jgi:hypothetical protein